MIDAGPASRIMKRKWLVRTIIVLFLLGVAVRFALVAMFRTSKETSALSRDKRYEAKVSSQWRTPFWGGASYDRHDIAIVSTEGRPVRHLVLDEPSNAWAQECSIQWAADSASVTFVFKSDEFEKTRVIVNVNP
jgi:hypothetical protein